MKKYLMSFAALMMFSVMLGFTVHADVTAPTACVAGQKTLNIHYFRFDGEYSTVGLHLWNTGTGGTGADVFKSSTDDFGAVFNICLGTDVPHSVVNEVDTYTVGVIPLSVMTTTGPDWNTKDTYKGKDMIVDVTGLMTGTATTSDIYFVSGQDGYLQTDNTKGVLIVAYFDPTQDYKNSDADVTAGDYWGIHAWNNDGPAVDWGTPMRFTSNAYYNGVDSNKMELIAIPVGAAASDTMGFIVHNGDAKKYGSDINIDLTGIKGSGSKIVFYVAGNSDVTTDVNTFIDSAFTFKFLPFTLSTLSGTYAPTANLIKVSFNQDVKIKTVDGDTVTQIFQDSFFTLKEGDTVIPSTDYEILYLDTTAVRDFAIQFNEGHELDKTKTYTLTFDNGLTGDDQIVADPITIDMDTTAPVITLVDDADLNIEITQGDAFTGFPQFLASDDRDGNITNKVYVPTGKGALDTSVLGDQKITLEVTDTWGNVTDLDFTVTVVAPAVEKSNTSLIIGVSVGAAVVVIGLGLATVFLKKK